MWLFSVKTVPRSKSDAEVDSRGRSMPVPTRSSSLKPSAQRSVSSICSNPQGILHTSAHHCSCLLVNHHKYKKPVSLTGFTWHKTVAVTIVRLVHVLTAVRFAILGLFCPHWLPLLCPPVFIFFPPWGVICLTPPQTCQHWLRMICSRRND